MTKDSKQSGPVQKIIERGWKPAAEGYQPLKQRPAGVGIDPTKVNGGYQPNKSQAPADVQPAPPPTE